MTLHSDEAAPEALDGGPTTRPPGDDAPWPRRPLVLVVDNDAGLPAKPDGDTGLGSPLPTAPSPHPLRRRPSLNSVRWVASAKTLTEVHRRLGYLIRRKRVQP